MKLFRSTPIAVKAVLLAGMLTACQNEHDSIPAPQAPDQSASDPNARTAVAVGVLVKDGNTELSYKGQNLLQKESTGSFYNEFAYAPQLITATRIQYGAPSTELKYTLDASGRCVQTVSDKTYIYVYNANGQLVSCYNKDNTNERRDFSYATDIGGWKKSLSMVTFYDTQGAKTKELKFSYGATGFIADKSPVNPDALPAGVSKYLPIFGTFATNLVKTLVEDKYLPNGQFGSRSTYHYDYTLDYAGKPTNITVKKANSTSVSSTTRKYFVPSYSF